MRKIILTLLLISVFILPACQNTGPIQVAYVAGLTGDLSELGINGRNAFLLKVDEVNTGGGINGRQIEVTVFDDGNSPDKIPELYEEIRAGKFEIVAGHIISALAEPVLVEAEKGDLLIVTATMSTTKLSDIDDYLIRTAVTTDAQSEKLAQVIKEDGIENLLILNDARNMQFVEDISNNLVKHYKEHSKTITYLDDHATEEKILSEIESGSYDGVLLSIPGEEAGYVSQLIKEVQPDMHLYGITWSRSSDLIQNGGNAVEGYKLTYRTIDEANVESSQSFFNTYQAVYKEESSFVGELTYEMANMLFEAMASAEDLSPQTLKTHLINHSFSGLTSDITINEMGDRLGGYSVFEVVNGEFELYEMK